MYPSTTEYGLYKESYNSETRQYPLTDGVSHVMITAKWQGGYLSGKPKLKPKPEVQ